MKIEDVLKKIDKDTLERLAKSGTGRDIVSKLTEADKKKLEERLRSLDAKTVQKKLDELNKSGSLEKLLKDYKK